MFEKHGVREFFSTAVRLRVVAGAVILAVAAMAAENAPDGGSQALPSKPRRITLEEVKQSADPVASPLARLGHLSVEAAKQHRLGVQADYFPKFGAVFANLHFSEFLGQVLAIRRPIAGSLVQVPVPLFGQNQTVAAVTFMQPITPLLEVRQAVRAARADERIAAAKAAAPMAASMRETEVEEAYFKLLIAQLRLSSTEAKFRGGEVRPLYAAAFVESMSGPARAPEPAEAEKALASAAAEVRRLTASLNGLMGWPEDTELELVPPDPLVENISLQQIRDQAAAANPDVIVAEQTLVKARAGAAVAKLAYVPTVAAVGGFMFQNVMPLVPDNFGYGGVIASYTLFDFGKREHAIKEAHIQAEMAELALQVTRAKVAAGVKQSYFELERARQLSQVAQKMGASLSVVMNVSANRESSDVKAARADVQVQMLEADLAHRQAYARLKALIGATR